MTQQPPNAPREWGIYRCDDKLLLNEGSRPNDCPPALEKYERVTFVAQVIERTPETAHAAEAFALLRDAERALRMCGVGDSLLVKEARELLERVRKAGG